MESALLYTLGVVLFFFFLMVSIALHELGHLATAKRFGAKVTDYFVGFGPTVWSRRRGETTYGFKALPLGGFVRIVGMLPPDKRHPTKLQDTNTGLLTQPVARAREEELEAIQPEDEHRLFYKLPWYKKFTVMAAGPAVNLLIAFFLFSGLFATYGDRSYVPVSGNSIPLVAVDECLIPWDGERRACEEGDVPSPAWEAGLRPGDELVSFNGVPIRKWEKDAAVISSNGAGEFTVVALRNGVERTFTGSTVLQQRPDTSTLNPDDTVEVGFLGVSPEHELQVVRGGPLYTAKWMGNRVVEVLYTLKALPEKLQNVAYAIVGKEERDRSGPMSIVGGSRIAGEGFAGDEPEQTPGAKVAFLVSLVAGFNLALGVLNALPILPLDGGHMAGSLWEGLRRGAARLTRRPEPGPFDLAKLMPVTQVVALFLFAMGSLLIVGDLVAPIRMGG